MFRLKSAVWELTAACSFSCRYCGSGGGRAKENELTYKECLRVARELQELGCERVSLIGGEIFLRPDWGRITACLTGRGIRVCIITNGFLMTEDIIQKLLSARVESVAVSLDSIEEVHDRYRSIGSYQRAMEAIRALSGHGIRVSVISTLNRESASRLAEFWEVLKTLPLSAWQLQACSPMGNAVRCGVDYRFDFHDVIHFVETHAATAPFPLGIADNIGYFTDSEGSLRGNSHAAFPGCSAGISSLGIDSTGNVRGCESMYDDAFIEGNVRQRPLAEIWNDEHAFSYNRKFTPALLTGNCATCEMSRFCAGGCRSYNYFVHGKLYESPFCARC